MKIQISSDQYEVNLDGVDTNELRQFSQSFWISSCVKTLMDEISSLDWDIIPKDEYEYDWVEKDIKKVKEFLLNPNKNSEPFSFLIKALLKDILEIDAGVIVKVFDVNSYDFENIEPKSGAPTLKPKGERTMTEIYVRDGASFLKEIDKFGFEKGYWQYSYQIPAHPMWFNRDEIVYVSEHPRSMSCYGYARTQAILDIVKSLHYSTLYNKRFFEETPIPDGALSLLDTNEVEMKQFMNYWNNEFKAQPHKVAIMNKDLKWQPFAVSQRELEFLETQKWYYNIVVSAFGLTPAEMGITNDLNRATSATQSELVKRKSIRPFLRLLENFINMGIVSEFEVEGVEFQFIYDDPAEKKARLDNWQMELNMGVKTVNEVREELGLEPVDGGDVSNSIMSRLAQGDSNVSDNSNPNKNNGPTREENREATGYKETLNREEAKAEGVKKSKDFKRMSYDDLIAEHKKLVAILESGNDDKIKEEAKEQKKELEQYISEAKKGVDDGQYYHDQPITQPKRLSGAMFQPQNQKNLVNCPICSQPTLATLNSLEMFQDDLRCTNCGARFKTEDLLNAPLMEEMSNVLHQHNVSKDFNKSMDDELDVKDYCGFDVSKSFPHAMQFADTKKYKSMLKRYLKGLAEEQVDSIIAILKNSLRGSDNISQVGKKIDEVIEDKERANLIARTEIIRLANEGNIMRMKQENVKYVKYISAPEDGRLCKDCARRDNQIYTLKQAEGMIPSHPRCRCTFTEYEKL